MSRGGETNGPASVYAIRKWDEWLRKFAPPGAADYDFYQSLPALSQGNVAQQIFWYTAFTAEMVKPKSEGNNTVDDKGEPLWRMAPSPKGPYWEEGMKLGYQDAGSWTLFKSTPLDAPQGGLAVRPVHGVQDRVAQEEPRRPHHHSRQRHPPRVLHANARRSSAAWSSSTARPTASAGRRPASTCPTIPSSRSSGGRTSAT